VTVAPLPNQSGVATITISVGDGQFTVSTNFLVTVIAVNDPPTISDIPNQSTLAGTPTAPIPFTVSDVDTALAGLSLSADSSNPALLPTNNIVFGGSGASRTVTVTPATGQTGTVTIAVSVSDGALTATDTFVLTVTAVNAAPTISAIASQSVNEDTATVAVGFTVGDAETTAGSLTVSATSSNLTLVPLGNIVFGGSGSNRTVKVTPAANVDGIASITISVSDGQSSTSASFLVTVNAVNDAPTITGVANQTLAVGGMVGPLSVTVGDVETPAASLTLSAASSNPTLVPENNIVLGGSGSNRTVSVSGAAGQVGSSTITLSVSDGTNSADTSFTVTVSALVTGTNVFTSTQAIVIPSLGAATPYPSPINVSGLGGVLSNVTVTLSGITHQRMRDIDALLVGPGGQSVILISDVGPNSTVNNVTLTLSDAAAASLGTSTLVSGTYKPTNITGGDTFAAPAPAGPYGTTLSVFKAQPVNGAWSLYVVDDSSGSTGRMAGGWSLTLTTVSTGVVNQVPTISDIVDQSTSVNTAVGPLSFTIGDVETAAGSLTVGGSSGNTALVPNGNIVFGGSGSNRTVTVTPAAGQTGSATITVSVSDGTNSASDSFVLAVNPVNTPPTITGIADQLINEDTSTTALGFTIGDAESAAGSLTVSGSSGNTALVPNGNMVFGGSGSNRTVTVSPAANQSGSATITVSVSDGQYTTSTNFVVTVNPVNDAPTITGLANQAIAVGGTVGPLSFVVGDIETPAAALTVGASSSNPALVPTNNIVLGGSGGSRTVTVTAVTNQTGSATISLIVSDGTSTASTSFILTVSAITAGTKSFTNSAAITIPDSGPATPYPSTINVTNLGGTVTNVTLTLRNLSHTWTRDIDILLVGPNGQKALVCSDVGNGGANNITFTLSDAAASTLPLVQLTAGTYRPADYETGDVLAAPAPVGPYTVPLSAFNGQSANGAWSLYVFDDGPGDLGSFAGGWSLTVTTVASAGDLTNSAGPARLSITLRPEKGLVVLQLDDASSRSYIIEASDDMSSWTTLGVVQLVNGSGSFADDNADLNAGRFYRARLAP
jgi:VCBS repeat-containing protein